MRDSSPSPPHTLPNWAGRVYVVLVVFSVLGTALSHFTGLEPGPIRPIASILTLLAGVATLLWNCEPSQVMWACVTTVWGATAEVIGLLTGFPFGHYRYTEAWWPTLPLTPETRFPLLLPLAWLLVALGAYQSVQSLPRRYAVAVAGFLTAVVDAVMEPVMTGPLDYWHWAVKGPLPGGAPVSNFLGWWFVGSVAAALLSMGESGPALLTADENSSQNSPQMPRWGPRVLLLHLALTLGIGLLSR